MEKALNPFIFSFVIIFTISIRIALLDYKEACNLLRVHPSLVILHGVCELQDMCEKGLCTILDTLPLL